MRGELRAPLHGAAAALAMAAVLASCASADDPRAPSTSAAIVGGTIDGADPAVVAILHRQTACGARQTTAVCSGTIIAPRVVLTAAHCVDPIESGPFDVFAGARVGSGGFVGAVVDTAIHPRYDRESHAFDAALLRLADAPDVVPVAVSTGAFALRPGDPVRAVGFGVDGKAGAFPDTKREGAMSVTGSTADTFDAAPSPAMTCTGDSGGPVFATGTAGGEELVGITVKGDPGCRETAENLRADAIRDDFIAPFVTATAGTSPGVPAGTIARDRLCDDACGSSADCPAALACIELAPGMKRCAFPGGSWGNLGAPCSDARGGGCAPGATCAFDPSASTCSCFTPCAGQPTAPVPVRPRPPDAGPGGGATSNGGCALSPPSRGGARWLALVVIAAAARRRSPRRPRPVYRPPGLRTATSSVAERT